MGTGHHLEHGQSAVNRAVVEYAPERGAVQILLLLMVEQNALEIPFRLKDVMYWNAQV